MGGYMSTYINTSNSLIDELLIDYSNSIILMKNSKGDVWWPEYNLNTIGNFGIGEGYQVKTTSSLDISLNGEAIPFNQSINLSSGWSFLGYLHQNSYPTEELLSDLVENNILIILKDSIGNVYWPEVGLNIVEQLEPGKGYQIKTTTEFLFSYPEF